jgi:putative ATP-dependent endonuclease of OLD family
MLIKRLHIANLCSIRSAGIDFGETTVLIGPSNRGKAAILEAVRIVVRQRWDQRRTGFPEYDIHLIDELCDPKALAPVIIEIELQERQLGEWLDDL